MADKFDDPVVAEVHAVRVAMLDATAGDVEMLMQQVATRQRESKHPIITQPFRKRTEQSDAREASLRADSKGRSRVPPA